jgi:hypothetical protein
LACCRAANADLGTDNLGSDTNRRRDPHICEARKNFFFEKKKQKTFDYYMPRRAWAPFILERR